MQEQLTGLLSLQNHKFVQPGLPIIDSHARRFRS